MHQSCKDFAELKQVKEIVEGVINCPWMDKNTYLVIAQELERNDIREFRSETCPKINGRLEESRSLKW
jgi:5,10-methenyltetrahydromethanopterin hydrogenase